MRTDLAVVIADAFRLRAIRLASPLMCRVLYFTDTNLVSAFESIRANEPGIIALESHFAHTAEGRRFVDRLQSLLLSSSEVHLISFVDGEWTTSLPDRPSAVVAPPAAGVKAPVVHVEMSVAGSVNTRRVPRFPVLDPLAMEIDGQRTSLVDMSVMGAQVLSAPQLRPNQRLKITLPDEEGSFLFVKAAVAWSAFETSQNTPRPYYRAGMEFTDAAAQALEEYCKRHCADEPLLPRR